MLLSSLLAQVLTALAGGMAAELLHWYVLSRKTAGVKAYRKHRVYWLTTAGMVLLGGMMPILYVQGSASALLCFHLGAATPIIVQKLVLVAPAAVAEQGAGGTSMREFFSW